jgi:hypothetical protein
MSQLNSVRNPDGIWINTSVFREAGQHFMKYGTYCSDPWGSPDWFHYWKEERRRCIEGYTVGGVKITGHHYFYLNYTQIKVLESTGSKAAKKITKFPDFWDGDYNYFWSLEIAKNGIVNDASLALNPSQKDVIKALEEEERNKEILKVIDGLQLEVKIDERDIHGAKHMIVGKSRRKGYSYKNGAICANIYNTIPESLTIIGAFEKKFLYPKGTMGMTSNYINFLNKNTAWVMPRDVVDKQDHRKASYITTKNGVKIEKGYMSEVMAITFKDNPDAARGKDADLILFEEAGAFPNLKDSYYATQPGLTAGDYITGQMVIFGTGGDMEGGTADFADMFERPGAFGLLRFENIWGEDSEGGKCGFFHPVNWNMEGYYDEHGNSDVLGAKNAELKNRQTIIDNSGNVSDIQKRVQEWPLNPAEAFLSVSTNNFPVVELRRQLEKVKAQEWHKTKGTPVELTDRGDYVEARALLNGKANPIYKMKPDNLSLEGCPVIYEYPIEGAPRNSYKIGYDPYRQEKGTSLAAILVYKTVIKGSYKKQIIVAEYVGRPQSSDDVNQISYLFAKLYNTKVMYENEVTHVKDWFRRRKYLGYLAAQPDAVISKNVKSSKVARVWGCHMNDAMKDAGEKYIKEWLITVLDFDDDGNKVTVIDQIYSIGLLEELIAYNRKGNFDRVMALMQAMFQAQEESLGEENAPGNSKVDELAAELIDMMDGAYQKNRYGSNRYVVEDSKSEELVTRI